MSVEGTRWQANLVIHPTHYMRGVGIGVCVVFSKLYDRNVSLIKEGILDFLYIDILTKLLIIMKSEDGDVAMSPLQIKNAL